MIKMNSTEKKVVRGKRTNKIKIQLYPKTALVRFITPNTVLKQRWKEKFTWIYIKNKKGDVSQIGSLGFIFLKVNAKYRYGRLQKKKKSQFLPLPESTYLQFSHQMMKFYFFATWTCAGFVTCFDLQKVEEEQYC